MLTYYSSVKRHKATARPVTDGQAGKTDAFWLKAPFLKNLR
jgi:hypothetical protein